MAKWLAVDQTGDEPRRTNDACKSFSQAESVGELFSSNATGQSRVRPSGFEHQDSTRPFAARFDIQSSRGTQRSDRMALAERHEQAALLRHNLDLTTDGSGQVIIVTGGIAVGKSALMRDFLERTGSAVVKLTAVASPSERNHTLGVMRQLLQEAPLDGTLREHSTRLLDKAGPEVVPPSVIYGLCQILLDLAAHGPLVIAVDDADHADAASLDCLLYLARRLRSVPLLMLLNQPAVQAADLALFRAELARQPYHSRLRLLPLSPAGTREVLAEHLPAVLVEHLAPAAHAVTGGNPSLVRALVDDQLPPSAELVVGAAFREAFVTCLHRYDNEFFQVVHALAILGEAAGRSAAGRLAGVDSDTVDHMLEVLAESGLLSPDGSFRHPEARTAVLRGGSQHDRAQNYQQAALILHQEGAGPTEVAQCLLTAATPPAAWAVSVLRKAAQLAMAADDPDLAARQLRLAYQAEIDPAEQIIVQTQLASAEWQLDPAVAGRHLPALVAAAVEGRLHPRSVPAVVKQLAWQGRIHEALVTLESANTHSAGHDLETVAALDAVSRYLSFLYPDVALPEPPTGQILSASGIDRARSAFAMVRRALGNAPMEGTVAAVEELMHAFRTPTNRIPGEAVAAALETLLYTDAIEHAERWTSIVHEEVGQRAVPAWQAIFAGARAEVAFRRGDLAAAVELGRQALSQMSVTGWGVAVGGPLSTLILATTARGDREEAAAALETPVPSEMMRTPLGVRYLYARGRHRLATNRLRSALDDFQTCGRLMQSWDMDQPALAPWRAEAATALLNLGQPAQARKLAEEELRRSSERRTRSRALALRALGMTGSTQRCAGLLTEAVEIFEECGDLLELAHTLKSLGEAHRAMGDTAQARMVLHRANQIAAQCGAEVMQRRISPHRQRTPDRPRAAPNEAIRLAELSEAERRVALLAAHGLTNREISARLYITLSTVEQHLTRVYRKLSIKSRNDLPRGLNTGFAQTA
ncbi:helix-turn-helix transcriptional regulator [Micromonospora tulbaghiae]|nr:LuxR family transcriptional regulator [Micromonospora tulbaghiae]